MNTNAMDDLASESLSISDGEDEPLYSSAEQIQDCKRHKARTGRKRLILVVTKAMLLLWLLFISITLIVLLYISIDHYHRSHKSQNELGEDVNGIVPKFSKYQFKFESDYPKLPNGGNSTDEEIEHLYGTWRHLMPRGRGFITVSNPEDYPLLPSPVLHQKDAPPAWGIALFHQIHCLNLIMKSTISFAKTGSMEEEWEHRFHCFDYLREVIMCHGDTSLERQDTMRPETPGTRGQLVYHNCKVYSEIYDWAEEHRLAEDHDLG